MVHAQRRFGERGYHGVSVEQLARELDLDGRAIYHYFPTKQALFIGAADHALTWFADQVVARVLVHDDLRSRLHGYVDLYRFLHRERPELVAFVTAVMIEGVGAGRAAAETAPRGTHGIAPRRRGNAGDRLDPDALSGLGRSALALNQLIAEQAADRRELSSDVTPQAAAALFEMVGMGLGIAVLDPSLPYRAMLDALDLMIDGALVRAPDDPPCPR